MAVAAPSQLVSPFVDAAAGLAIFRRNPNAGEWRFKDVPDFH
jgi:hypothetical protein